MCAACTTPPRAHHITCAVVHRASGCTRVPSIASWTRGARITLSCTFITLSPLLSLVRQLWWAPLLPTLTHADLVAAILCLLLLAPVMSAAMGFYRIGLLVLLAHDISDITVDLLKLCNYLDLSGPRFLFLTEIMFAVNMGMWIYWRLYVHHTYTHREWGAVVVVW